MCGIAGAVGRRPGVAPPSIESLQAMAMAMRHRGPDELGVYRDAIAGLAHARLSIVDLGSGQQPMSDGSGDLWIVYSGEVYNYVELRAELEAAGHRFRTRSDTEVALHAYAAWGDAAFARFNGQFALAIWNARTSTLVLARDRFGVRPLHVAEHAGRVVFASEVKAIFAFDPSFERALDPFALDETFTFWAALAPRSAFRGVGEVPPGHVRTYRLGREPVERAYWEPSFPEGDDMPFRGTIVDAAERVQSALREATRLRALRADVPVGCYLSGGLDSSFVTALAHEEMGGRLRTFSLRFDDAAYDETAFQHAVVAHVGSVHDEIVVGRREIADAFPEVVRHTERTLLRTAAAPLFLLSKRVRDAGIKVVLTGEAADEMFAGYDVFREAKVRRFWAKAPHSEGRPRLLERLYPYLTRSPSSHRALARGFFGRDLDRAREAGFGHGPRWRSASALKRLFSGEVRAALAGHDAAAGLLAALPPSFPRWSPLAQDQYLEARTLLSGYLLSSQGDRVLMGHSVEGRFPFLDPAVVALAASLPPAFKLRVLDEKHVLKRAAVGVVPRVVLERKKQPYRAPDAIAFVGADAPEWVASLLAPRAVRDAGMFDPELVARLYAKCRAAEGEPSNADNMALVGVVSTGLLHEELVRRSPIAARDERLRTRIDRLEEDRPHAK